MLLAFLWTATAAAEVIRSFDTAIRIEDPATLRITETIVMDFGQAPRRGIFRVIPVRYERYENAYSIDIRVESVTDQHGAGRPYTSSRQGDSLSIRIGDPDVWTTGEHVYVITYTARRAMNFFSGEPEVYWNATGNEWPFVIEKATAQLFLPEGIAIDAQRVSSFMGPPGSRVNAQSSMAGGVITYTAGNLQPGSGLTIIARLPTGSVRRPTVATSAGWWLRDWWPAAVLPLASLGIMFWAWRRRGRDIGGGQAIAVEWNPPEGLSPAEVGTLVDEVCHTHDIVATIIDLAARGHLKIHRIDAKGMVGFGKSDYRFQRLTRRDTWAELLSHEQKMLESLFEDKDDAKLSELRGKFHTHFAAIRGGIYRSLAERGFFRGNPQSIRVAFLAIAVLLVAVGVACTIFLGKQGLASWGVGVVLAALPAFAFAPFMPARTLKGSTALRECRGFRRFLMMVERDRLAEAYKQDPGVFGRLLPYAMVLGVEDKWATQFEGLMDRPPDWFEQGHQAGPFVPSLFLSDLGRGVSAMGTNLAAQPASSGAGGGSSGFSSGGGFSGGGFGGGGGGSW